MLKETKTPCEEIVWYWLPALRREIAKELVNSGHTQREVAKLLGVTEAAVSQYMRSKRGYSERFDAALKKEVKVSANNVANGGSIAAELCRLCNKLKGEKALCIKE